MEPEFLIKVIELLSVHQINPREINENTENFITVKETGKHKKIKLNRQQDHRIPMRNSFEILPIEECQDKSETTDEGNLMFLYLIMHLVKEGRKSSQLNTTNKRRLTLLTNNMQNPLNRRTQI